MSAIADIRGKIPAIPLEKLGKFGGMMKREYLDHKTKFFWVPLIIAGFMVFFTVSSAIIGNGMLQELGIMEHLQGDKIVIDGEEASTEDLEFMLDRFNSMDLRAIDRALGLGMLTVLSPFFLAIPIIILFGLLGSLYDDRRDRSYLFWKSMPVSDTREVLTKLFSLTVMGPAIIIAFAALFQIIWMLVHSIWGAAYGLPVASFLFSNVPTVSLWFGMLSIVVLAVIWGLPIIGYLMLVSSVAKKAPLLVAIVPIAAITAMEGVFLKSTLFIKAFVARLIGWAVELKGRDFDHVDVGERLNSPFFSGAWERLMEGMATGSFWISTAVGVAFIAGAIHMRRYNVN